MKKMNELEKKIEVLEKQNKKIVSKVAKIKDLEIINEQYFLDIRNIKEDIERIKSAIEQLQVKQ